MCWMLNLWNLTKFNLFRSEDSKLLDFLKKFKLHILLRLFKRNTKIEILALLFFMLTRKSQSSH